MGLDLGKEWHGGVEGVNYKDNDLQHGDIMDSQISQMSTL